MKTDIRIDLDYVLKIASEFNNKKTLPSKEKNLISRHTKRANNALCSGVNLVKDIYLMKVGKSNYKIGISKDPNKRLKGVQTGNQHKVTLVHSISSFRAAKIEILLHLIFSGNRMEGEWFKFNRFDVPYIIGVMNKLAVSPKKGIA